MVNKEVCRKCWKRYKPDDFDDKYFESTWINGDYRGVLCPGETEAATEGHPPPVSCPHKLEHAVAAGISDD
jgi:hypothetical protein